MSLCECSEKSLQRVQHAIFVCCCQPRLGVLRRLDAMHNVLRRWPQPCPCVGCSEKVEHSTLRAAAASFNTTTQCRSEASVGGVVVVARGIISRAASTWHPLLFRYFPLLSVTQPLLSRYPAVRPGGRRFCHYVFMCFAPSFLPFLPVGMTRIRESKRGRPRSP